MALKLREKKIFIEESEEILFYSANISNHSEEHFFLLTQCALLISVLSNILSQLVFLVSLRYLSGSVV